MLRDSLSAATPHLELSVRQLLQEDSLFDQNERRSVHREFLVRPVVLELRQSNQQIEGFSRNISYLGISIVTRIPILAGSVAKLRVHRLSCTPSLFLAECRWVSPFGDQWNVSGWNFLNVDLQRLESGV